MITRVKVFIILICLIASQAIFSQSNYFNSVKLPVVLPPSPDVAGMEKFGSIPVSYSTGVPDISIPVWNISCGNISWPLSLSYHAGGIKVDEIASNAGLGWTLVGPGTISRSMVGRPDEYDIGEPVYTSVDDGDYQYLYDVRDGKKDSEYDIFNYNFNGRNGKFIIKQDGTIFQIPYSGLKIENNLFQSFLVTDENGVTYLFDQKEETDSEAYDLSGTTILPDYYSTWYLSKVELPDKQQKIEFTYSYAGYSSQYFYNFSHFIGTKYGPSHPSWLQFYNEWSSTSTRSQIQSQLLTGISFPNGNIVVNYVTDRLDKVGTSLQRISEIIVNRNGASGNEQVKKMSLAHSNFFYKPPGIVNNDPTQYRLKLTSITEYGNNSASPKVYSFDYNTTPLVPRGNYGQDKWGFNNGQYANYTLIPAQTIYWQTAPYSIGHANRSVDVNAMQGWMLKTIAWPTGGKTEFVYEPHQYYAGQVIVPVSKTAAAVSDIQLTDVNTFTFPSSSASDTRINIFISRYNFTGVTAPTEVTVKDITTSTQIYFATNTTAEQDISIDNQITLIPGHNYELKVQLFTTVPNGQLRVTAAVNWNDYTSQPNIETGGGLRIKEIKNYTQDNVLATREKYEYEPATTLTPFNFINQAFKEVINKYCYIQPPPPPSITCWCNNSPTNYLYFGNSVFPISTAMGSPMLYTKVTRLLIDEQETTNNGKSEYEYDVIADNIIPQSSSYFFTVPISNEWKNGFLSTEKDYTKNGSSFTLIRKKQNYYTEYKANEVNALKVNPRVSPEGECENQLEGLVYSDIDYFLYPIYTGSKKLTKTEETLFDGANQITTITESEYASPNYDFVTKTTLTDSKGSKQIVTYKYPHDFTAPGNVSEKMVTKNIIAPVIEQKAFSGTILLSTIKNNYKDWYNDSKILTPEIIQGALFNNSLENRIRFYNYDLYGKQLEMSKENDVRVALLWDHNNQHPVAEVNNANLQQVAYTSFETGNKGNWTYAGVPVFDPTTVTGKNVYDPGSGQLTRTISLAGTYIVSYWSKNGQRTVNGTTATAGRTINGWTYYEHKPVLSANGTVTVSGSGVIDELRLYPDKAMMTTFIYEPLTGVKSKCDANNLISYYEYDGFGRLSLVRDQNKNVVKTVCYNYAGQPINCVYYYNDNKTANYTRNNCGPGYIGGNFFVSLPAGTFGSTISVADANNTATQYGQAQANMYGACIPDVPCSFSMSSGYSAPTKDISKSGNTVSFYLAFYANSTWLFQNNSYTIANITGSCIPNTTNLLTINSGGRTWSVTINSSGQFIVQIISGGDLPPNTVVSLIDSYDMN